jgi:glutamyl-tRNA synthetase
MKSVSPLSEADRNKLVEMLFPDHKQLPTLEQLEAKYPKRDLPAGAIVCRVAPSPTGFAHIGLIYMSTFNYKVAVQSGGVFIVRIEDTDTQREIKGATATIGKAISYFKVDAHEGLVLNDNGEVCQKGAYGPYVQSERKEIYRAACIHLLKTGLAYPCFCTPAELEEVSELQRVQKLRPGYYGAFAKWRDAPLAKIEQEFKSGIPFVIRFRAFGLQDNRVSWNDGVRGKTSFPEHDVDTVILKSDGQSLYHLAHLVDDHFMRITDIIRGEEWLSSVPLHIQLYEAFGWDCPRFTHLSHMMKVDIVSEVDPETGKTTEKQARRKLSKRKDPDADVAYFVRLGYPADSVIEYLLNILNSNFEDWRRANPDKPHADFAVSFDKLPPSGALADLVKLGSVSRDVISRYSADQIYKEALIWSKSFEPELFALLEKYREFSIRCLGIERGGVKPNKRFTTWADLREQMAYMYKEVYSKLEKFDFPENVSGVDRGAIIQAFMKSYAAADNKDTWFAKCKEFAAPLGFAVDMKEYKKNPAAFKGSISDVTTILRVAITGSRQSPDLWEIMQVLGVDESMSRLQKFAK